MSESQQNLPESGAKRPTLWRTILGIVCEFIFDWPMPDDYDHRRYFF